MRPITQALVGHHGTVVIWVIAANILISLLFVGDGPGSRAVVHRARAVGTVGWLVWVACGGRTCASPARVIEVRNPLRTVRLPWDEVRDVDSRRFARHHDIGRLGVGLGCAAEHPVRATAVPSTWPSAHVAQRTRVPGTGCVARGPPEPDAAEIIRRVQAGRTKVAETGEPYETVVTAWNFIVIAISVVLIGWSVTLAALTHRGASAWRLRRWYRCDRRRKRLRDQPRRARGRGRPCPASALARIEGVPQAVADEVDVRQIAR